MGRMKRVLAASWRSGVALRRSRLSRRLSGRPSSARPSSAQRRPQRQHQRRCQRRTRRPLSGAMVSALGATIGDDGHRREWPLLTRNFPPAITRCAHTCPASPPPVARTSVSASCRHSIDVAAAPARRRRRHRRNATARCTARPILAAGFGLPRGDRQQSKRPTTIIRHPTRHGVAASPSDAQHPQGLRRASSSSKTTTTSIGARRLVFGRAMRSARPAWPRFFADLPFTGEVNLLTTGRVCAGRAVLRRHRCRAASPTWRSARRRRAATGRARGDERGRSVVVDRGRLVRSRSATAALLRLRLSYSTQEYQGGNPLRWRRSATATATSARSTASIAGPSSRRSRVDYGGRYARYDYLRAAARCSARASASRSSRPRTRASRAASRSAWSRRARRSSCRHGRRSVAAARAHVRAAGDGRATFRVERARFFDVGSSTSSTAPTSFGVRRFYQGVDNQLVTLFGLPIPGGPELGRPLLRGERRRRRRGRLGVRARARRANARPRVGRLQLARWRMEVARRHRRRSPRGPPTAGRPRTTRTSTTHDVARDRHSGNRDARVRALQD